ncbi:MAG TPA: ABC transporter ATP-binding protein/permease [Hyphomicrobiaceae bacterium]|nr:ABC transporter ATP-binding protein/permease [Hyphomicrobiaceae bacterium]
MDTNLFRYVWRHSRREQLVVLSLILLSLPFYFASLDVPKTIVNEALQGRAFAEGNNTAVLFRMELNLPTWSGGGSVELFPGLELERLPFLLTLCGLFLTLVLINGAFKFVINTRKGILGEKLLRQLRYDLFALLLRFRPEDIRAVKPAEAASVIKDEVEPIGDFAGDAFIQPFFLGTQALTALTFIMVQNAGLGAIALAVVLVQAVLIPRLRRRLITLGVERQIESRRLAGRIGAVVEAAPAIHTHGAAAYNRAGVNNLLARLLAIRIGLFKRKFAVKYLNNLLAQITPFFFYSFGGYLALRGHLDLGQLLAVIVAYRDLPPPIKELIDWDQQRTDITVKYQQVASVFATDGLLPHVDGERLPEPPPHDAPIVIDGLQVADRAGNRLLERFSAMLPRPGSIALVGPAGSGREALARALGRQITDYQGEIRVGEVNLAELPNEVLSRVVNYAGPEPGLLPGSIRENVTLGVRHVVPPRAIAGDAQSFRPDLDQLWLDYGAAGASSAEELDDLMVRALRATGMLDDIYKFGLLGRLPPSTDPRLVERLVEARHSVRAELGRRDLLRLVEPFDLERYNLNATIAENLLFGVPLHKELSGVGLVNDPYLRSVLAAEELNLALAGVGVRIAETALEMVAGMSAGHALFERYSFIAPQEMEDLRHALDNVKGRDGAQRFDRESEIKFIGLAFRYIEARHRFNLVDPRLMGRIVRARHRFHDGLPKNYASRIEFYDPERFVLSAPIRDNLLFGKTVFGLPNTEQMLWEVMRKLLGEIGLEQAIYRLGLDYDVGPSGKLISAQQRAAISIARSLIKRPQMLILDGALAAFNPGEAREVLNNIRTWMAGRTLMVSLSDIAEAKDFDCVIRFEGACAALASQPAEAA